MTDSSPTPQTGRTVTVMLTGGLPPPASFEIQDDKGKVIQRYVPSSLVDVERTIIVQLIKAVKLALVCFNAHRPSSQPMRHYQADVAGRLDALVAEAEAVIAEKVEDPPPLD